MQYCSISIVNALEMLQSCTKPSIWTFPDQRSCLTWKCPLNSHSSIYAITSFEMVNSPYARNIPSTIQCDQLVWYKCQALYAITYTLEFADREKYCRWWVAACLELSHLLNQAVTHLKLTLCKQYHANWQKNNNAGSSTISLSALYVYTAWDRTSYNYLYHLTF